jgi:hypothetical protein
VAAEIGVETGKLSQATAAGLIAAGLLSAALFPAGAARLLTRSIRAERRAARTADIPAAEVVIPPARAPLTAESPQDPASPLGSPADGSID